MSTTITGNVASQKKKPQQAKPQVQQKLQENVSFFDEKWFVGWAYLPNKN